VKAAVIKSPGNIEIEQIEKPAPEKGEVLLKVNACALCGTDQRVLAGEKHVDVPVVGHEISGVVEELGEGVTDIKIGQRFDIQTVIGCNECEMCKQDRQNLCEKGFTAIGYQYNGGFAEYMIMPEEGVRQGCLIPVPDSLSDDEVTLIEPLSCCINGMRPIPMEQAEHVLILGGGIIGVLNGLVAKARGAKMVSVADISSQRLDLLKKLEIPFDHFIDSSKNDPVEWVNKNTRGQGVDVVVVAASVKQLVKSGIQVLKRDGHLSIFAGMPKSNPVEEIDLNVIHYKELHIHGANSSVRRDYVDAVEYLSNGSIDGKKLVTHHFSLDDFNKAVQVQKTPSENSLKIIIQP
jgi:L-iditol 2-dehydrogenase